MRQQTNKPGECKMGWSKQLKASWSGVRQPFGVSRRRTWKTTGSTCGDWSTSTSRPTATCASTCWSDWGSRDSAAHVSDSPRQTGAERPGVTAALMMLFIRRLTERRNEGSDCPATVSELFQRLFNAENGEEKKKNTEKKLLVTRHRSLFFIEPWELWLL